MDYRLLVQRGRSTAQAIPLGDGVTVAGRQEDCGLRIASSQVSRRHCEIFEKKGLLLVKDLGSSNGTFVNGTKIEGQRVLEHGDVLAVGPIQFKIEQVSKVATTKKPGDTAVGGAGAMAIDDEDLIEVEEEVTAHTISDEDEVTDFKAAHTKPGAVAASQGETVEFNEEDVADFLLELDADDKN